jgi:predicted DNA-binding protein (MmcQ/YjbR family)
MPITLAELHARLIAFPGAELDHPFGPEVEVYKLRGKVFAMAVQGEAAPRVTLKCDPVLAEILREAHTAVRPGYHTDKRHWNTVYLEVPLEEEVLWNMVEASYELVRKALPKKLQAELDRVR